VRLGLRRGELLGLRWRDIDFDRHIIRVRQQVTRTDEGYRISATLKTPAARRDLPLEDDIAEMLRYLKTKLGARADVKDLVFPDKDGNERDPQSITRNFARLAKRLGLGDFHLHDLRHTAVTRWRRAGVDLEVAAALAGHEKADVTANVYSDADMDRKRAALKQVS
jgi:integrase